MWCDCFNFGGNIKMTGCPWVILNVFYCHSRWQVHLPSQISPTWLTLYKVMKGITRGKSFPWNHSIKCFRDSLANFYQWDLNEDLHYKEDQYELQFRVLIKNNKWKACNAQWREGEREGREGGKWQFYSDHLLKFFFIHWKNKIKGE